MSHIFISYSRKDSACVDKVTSYLEENDFPFWIDRKRIELGTEWFDEITNNILQAGLFLLFWSKNSRDSNYVQAERRIALQQYHTGKLQILPVILDPHADLPPELDHIQREDFSLGCDDVAIRLLVNRLPAKFRRFNRTKPLAKQPYKQVEDTPFVSVRYKESASGQCQAYLVGQKEFAAARSPRELVICLQFMQPVNKNMIKDVYETLGRSDSGILHITGPRSVEGDRYWIDNKNPDLWQECFQFVTQVIQENASSDTTTLKFFGLSAGVLLARVAMKFYRFWHVQFYNFAPETGKPYVLVYDVPRNSD